MRELKKSKTGTYFDNMAEVDAHIRAAFSDYVGFYFYRGESIERALDLAVLSIKDCLNDEVTQILAEGEKQ